LTDAQQTQVKALLQAERSKVAPLLAEAASNRQQLHESTVSENLMNPGARHRSQAGADHD